MNKTACKQWIYKAYEYLLETIAPQDPIIRRIEHMTIADFMNEVMKEGRKDLPDNCISFLSYKDTLVKTALLEVKSYGNKRIAKLLGALAYEMLLTELSDLEMLENFTDPMIISIPITRKSMRKRGWNQCELMLRGIQSMDNSRILEIRTDILLKTKETGDQVGKSRSERFENLKGCFEVKKEGVVAGRNVIIFDDIITTGATLLEAKRALKNSGARKVLCVAIAH